MSLYHKDTKEHKAHHDLVCLCGYLLIPFTFSFQVNN